MIRDPRAVLLGTLLAGCAGAGAPPGTVLVAAVQCPSRMGDVAGNADRLERLTREAAAKGAKIVVLPEASLTGYLSQDLKENWLLPGRHIRPDFQGRSPAGIAEAVPGPMTDRFGRLAKALGIYLALPFVEVDPKTGRYFNTVCLLDPEGRVLLHYRKLNPWMIPEHSWVTEGDRGLAYADTPYGRLGLLICFDVHRVPAQLAAAGVETLLYPIAWVDGEDVASWFDQNLPEVASENGVNIVGANWSVEQKQDWYGYGFSRVISRDGKVLAKASTQLGDEIVYATLDLSPRQKPAPRAADAAR